MVGVTGPDEVPSAVEELWHAVRPLAEQRVELIRTALRTATAGTLTEGERTAALGAAHKLVGALGSYGRPAGTAAAGEAEAALAGDPVEVERLRGAVRRLEDVVSGGVR